MDMAESDFKNVTPGFPALNPQVTAENKAGSGGAIDVPSASVTDANKVTPLSTFTYNLPGSGPTTFYKGNARVVSPTVAADLRAKGLVS